MINFILKIIPESLSKRTALLIALLGAVTIAINVLIIFYFEYKLTFRTAVNYINAQYEIMSSELAESIITEDIYSLFTSLENVAHTVPHIDNIAVTDSRGNYITDANVRIDNLTATVSPIEIRKPIKAGGKLLGHIVFYINRESIVRQIASNVAGIIFTSIFIVIIGTIAGIYIAGKMTNPIKSLSSQIGSLDVLKLPYRFSISRYASKEAKELKSVIENLSVELKESLDRIQEQQKEIIRSERLAYLGTMSAGLAHELKNPIMAINLVLNSVSSELEATNPWHEDFSVIHREADKLVFRINEFLEYSRPVNLMYEQTSLFLFIEYIKEQTYSGILKQVDIIFSAEEDAPLCTDLSKMSQVLNIFLNNSAEAGAKHIYISFGFTGGILNIDYADDGVGFKTADISKIMIPFYTTKPKGSGLGLAICSTIMDAMGGTISVSANMPKGARFNIQCPADFKCKVFLP